MEKELFFLRKIAPHENRRIDCGGGSSSGGGSRPDDAKLNLIFSKGFVFRNETYFQKYTGVNRSFDSNFTLWSMGITKKFLKNDSAELELSVFDLLGENQSFDQTVNAQYVEEVQTQLLQLYLC